MFSISVASDRAKNIWRHHGLRGVVARVIQKFTPPRDGYGPAAQRWIHQQMPLPKEVYLPRIEEFKVASPHISILCPVCDPPLHFLRTLIESVQSQVYPHWELCIVDDASKDSQVRELLESVAKDDSRVKFLAREERGHIARASQMALEMATGAYIALVDHDDVLPHHALFHVVETLQREDPPRIIYSDEAKISETGELFEPSVKPDWSPLYFRSFMYTGHLTVYERSLVEEVGGFRSGYDGSQDYDLMLRCARQTDRITHIPRILYYWRTHGGSVSSSPYAKVYALEAAERALSEELNNSRGSIEAKIEKGPFPGTSSYTTERVSLGTIEWGDETSIKDLRERLLGISEEFVYLRHERVPSLDLEDQHLLASSFAFEETLVVGPLLVDAKGVRVEAAGWSRLPDGYSPNLKGASLAFGGPGHRLYVAHEVDALSPVALLLKREELSKLLRGEEECGAVKDLQIHLNDPYALRSLVLDPRVRIPLRDGYSGIGSFPLVVTPESRRYYPIGFSPKQASFRFES